MKSAKVLVLTFALALLGASAAFGQAQFTTTSTIDLIAPNAQTGSVGNQVLTALAAGTIGGPVPGADTLTISYGGAQISVLGTIVVRIDVDGAAGPNAPVLFPGPTTTNTACVATAAFGTYGNTLQIQDAAIDTDPGVERVSVTINPTTISITFNSTNNCPVGGPFPASDAVNFVGAPTNGTIEILNIRLNVVPVTTGCTITGQLNANLTSIGGLVTVTNPNLPVATVADPINLSGGSPIPSALRPPGTFSTGAVALGPTVDSGNRARVQVRVNEVGAFTDAFETKAGAPTQLIFSLTGIPTGVTVRISASANWPRTVLVPAADGINATATVNHAASSQSTGTATIIVDINAQDSTLSEIIAVEFQFEASAATLSTGVGQLTVTLGPPAGGLTGNIVAGGTGIPFGPADPFRYFRCDEPPLNIVQVVQAVTELLSSHNASIPGSTGFNTGFAVNNATGFLGIVGQTDTIVVTVYPADGSPPSTLTTSATIRPGIGLNASGQLPPGATWLVLLSDILPRFPTPITGSFQGMIRFTCNFTHGHGVNFLSDNNFAVTSQGYQMLSIAPTLIGRPGIFESTGH